MEFFQKAKAVKLRGHHNKYLWADDDECMISQSRDGSKRNAFWMVELDRENGSMVKLKSCYDCYLTATNVPFLLGMTGNKVLQMKLIDSESSILWEPIRDVALVKFKNPFGNYLRANGTIPPWRNSVTHDAPHRSSMTQEWLLWEVMPVQSLDPSGPSLSLNPSISTSSLSSNHLLYSPLSSPRISSTKESSSLLHVKADGRTIHFAVGDDDGEIPEKYESEILFKGYDLGVLTEKLKEETGITEDIILCSRNHFNNKLYPLHLQLPPNNAEMFVVVVKAPSRAAKYIQNGAFTAELEASSFDRLPSFDDII